MSKLEQLINELCPNGVEYKTLGEIGKFTRGNGLQKKDFVDTGKPVIHYGQIYTKYNFSTNITHSFTEEEVFKKLRKAKKNDILIATTSENVKDVAKCVVWLGEEEIGFSGDMYSFSTQENSKYIAYYFQTNYFQKQKELKVTGTKVMRIHSNDMEKFEIPLPPLPVQEEIVRILDTFTELTTELTMRKQQYEYYSKKLFNFNNSVKLSKLADIANIGTGSSNTNEQLEVGDYPFFVRSQEIRRKNEYEFDETAIITSGDGVGVGKIFHFVSGKYALHQRAYRINITDSNIIPKYFFYYMKNMFYEYILKSAYSSSVTSIRRPMLNNFYVPLPPLEEQQRIVDILDRFDALVNDIKDGLPAEIEARQKQYEYYRDKLLTFKKNEKIMER